MSEIRVMSLALQSTRDVVAARARVRRVAESLGLSALESTALAAAASELGRNAVVHGQGGTITMSVIPASLDLRVVVEDSGPGIPDVDALLERGTMGLTTVRRTVDSLDLSPRPGGGLRATVQRRMRTLPAPERLRAVAVEADQGGDPVEELFRQNRALGKALDEVASREFELNRVNRELDETNRGVVALHGELEERADALKSANDTKSRFLSFMSHEFRTPLAAVLSLSEILLARADGPLLPEQEHQVKLIRRSAETLSALIEELLDLSKLEAGRMTVSPAQVDVGEVLAGVRALFRAIPTRAGVTLNVAEPATAIAMWTDDGRLAQILRNLVSNALKFTEAGSVTLTATDEGDHVVFSCIDTGIGIAREDQERIFADFAQVDSATQRRVRGTGLGLGIVRRLTELLGGTLFVESEVGRGSAFRVHLPKSPPVHPEGASP